MDGFTLFGIALALAMDAFAVALGTGLTLDRLTGRHLFRFGFHFGLFQAGMPVLGWLAGMSVQRWIVAYDHWLAFGLLALIGGKMIREALQGEEKKGSGGDPTRGWSLVLLSIATSIDALAIGLSLALLGVAIWVPAAVIGLVCAALTIAGMLLGQRLNSVWGSRVEILGGLVLIGIGIKILLEHTIFQ